MASSMELAPRAVQRFLRSVGASIFMRADRDIIRAKVKGSLPNGEEALICITADLPLGDEREQALAEFAQSIQALCKGAELSLESS